MNKNLFFQPQTNEKGAIAIFLSVAISILLLTVTVYASRLAVSEVRQASQIDRSDQAYYAAEAGIEEALRRIDSAPDEDIEELFPEQNSSPYGADQAVLTGNNDEIVPLNVEPEAAADEIAPLAWRNRKVYDSDVAPSGTQVKDESIQLDLSDLRQASISGNPCGPEQACDGGDLYDRFDGIEYCWTPTAGNPQFEWTIISWPENNIASSSVRKVLLEKNHTPTNITYGSFSSKINPTPYDGCTNFNITDKNRRYIVRIKPIFEVGNPASQDAFTVNYRVQLQDSIPGELLFIQDDSYLIDVVGQSGDIRRRVIAKKERNGRLLGIFDFLLYSGDPSLPLCKFGVQQQDVGYNLNDCSAGNIENSTPPPTPPPMPQPQNVALGKSVTRYSSESPAYRQGSLSNIVDGNLSTYYYPGSFTFDIEVDLGQSYNLGQIKATWNYFGCSPQSPGDSCNNGHTYISGYTIRTSANRSSYSTVKSGGIPHETTTAVNGTFNNVRYIRVTITQSSNWLGIYELEAYQQ